MEIMLLSVFTAFLTTLILTPKAIQFLKGAGIVAIDLHKRDKPVLPASGGICVSSGVLMGILLYAGLQTFTSGTPGSSQISSVRLLAATSSVLIVTLAGLLDDLNVRERAVKTKDGRNVKIGFPQWLKPILTLPGAIPLIVIRAGVTRMNLPLLGVIDFGILYPLVIVPVGFVGASNMVNMLGGFNGLEAGMGALYTFSLGLYILLAGEKEAAVLLLTACAALIAFLVYNWYPARILPGDSLTYLLGSLVATGVILGNMERAGLIVMLPFILEFFMKARSRFKASCIGKLRPDGKLESPYGRKVYSWTHILMNLGCVSERQVTLGLIILQSIFAVLPFFLL
ncbi:hypothetical protein CW702_01265 [Candidatus Bathyarchaeota archaeon]|nr:MAG: hypothetical protein CW702_01265 [Candidatus Bathyarchaeota archaeon]